MGGALAAGLMSAATACAPVNAPAQVGVAAAPGAVELNQGPPSDALVGGSGAGTVTFHGQVFRFAISGLGLGGAAVAVLQTSGEVYHLADIAGFPGTYRRAPSAVVVPGRSEDGLWLLNERATIMHLRIPPRGRMPDIGNDALRVVLGQ